MVECPKFITVFRSLLIFFSSFLEFNGQHLLIMIDVIKTEEKMPDYCYLWGPVGWFAGCTAGPPG